MSESQSQSYGLPYLIPDTLNYSNIKLCVPRYQPPTNTSAYCFAVQYLDQPIRLCTPACHLPYGSVRFTCRLLPMACDNDTREFIRTVHRIDSAICSQLANFDFQLVLDKCCRFQTPIDIPSVYRPTIQGGFLKKSITLHNRSFTRSFNSTNKAISTLPFGSEIRMIIRLSHVWIQPRPDSLDTVASIYSIWDIVQARDLGGQSTVSKCLVPAVSYKSCGTQTIPQDALVAAKSTAASAVACETETKQHRAHVRERIHQRGVPLISSAALRSVKLKKKKRHRKKNQSKSKLSRRSRVSHEAFPMVTVELLKSRRSSLRSCRVQEKKKRVPGKPSIAFPSFQDLRRKRIVRRRTVPARPFLDELMKVTLSER